MIYLYSYFLFGFVLGLIVVLFEKRPTIGIVLGELLASILFSPVFVGMLIYQLLDDHDIIRKIKDLLNVELWHRVTFEELEQMFTSKRNKPIANESSKIVAHRSYRRVIKKNLTLALVSHVESVRDAAEMIAKERKR